MLGKKYIDEQVTLIRAEINDALSAHVKSIIIENEMLKEQVQSLNISLVKTKLQLNARINVLAMRKPWKS